MFAAFAVSIRTWINFPLNYWQAQVRQSRYNGGWCLFRRDMQEHHQTLASTTIQVIVVSIIWGNQSLDRRLSISSFSHFQFSLSILLSHAIPPSLFLTQSPFTHTQSLLFLPHSIISPSLSLSLNPSSSLFFTHSIVPTFPHPLLSLSYTPPCNPSNRPVPVPVPNPPSTPAQSRRRRPDLTKFRPRPHLTRANSKEKVWTVSLLNHLRVVARALTFAAATRPFCMCVCVCVT